MEVVIINLLILNTRCNKSNRSQCPHSNIAYAIFVLVTCLAASFHPDDSSESECTEFAALFSFYDSFPHIYVPNPISPPAPPENGLKRRPQNNTKFCRCIPGSSFALFTVRRMRAIDAIAICSSNMSASHVAVSWIFDMPFTHTIEVIRYSLDLELCHI